MKKKSDWLRQLRRCSNDDTLYIVGERIMNKLTGDEKEQFMLAYDHRKAELITSRVYDKIPVSVWKLVK